MKESLFQRTSRASVIAWVREVDGDYLIRMFFSFCAAMGLVACLSFGGIGGDCLTMPLNLFFSAIGTGSLRN